MQLINVLLAPLLATVASALTLPRAANGTSTVVKRGSHVPYGHIINHCNRRGVIALTFDDGPSLFTEHVLRLFDTYGGHTTFFINGHNYAIPLDDENTRWPALLRRMVNSGHQVASHTWTHANLDQADSRTRRDQMLLNERAMRNVLGFRPTYMRPPYGECSGHTGCQNDMAELGYHVINWDIDTRDWEFQHDIGTAQAFFSDAVSENAAGHSYICLAHDIHKQTVFKLAEHMIREARSKGYELVTVGECLGDPQDNWYAWDERR